MALAGFTLSSVGLLELNQKGGGEEDEEQD